MQLLNQIGELCVIISRQNNNKKRRIIFYREIIFNCHYFFVNLRTFSANYNFFIY